MQVICENDYCKYKTNSGFCKKEYLFLNQNGACSCWWNKAGGPRPGFYEPEVVKESEQKPSADKNE